MVKRMAACKVWTAPPATTNKGDNKQVSHTVLLLTFYPLYLDFLHLLSPSRHLRHGDFNPFRRQCPIFPLPPDSSNNSYHPILLIAITRRLDVCRQVGETVPSVLSMIVQRKLSRLMANSPGLVSRAFSLLPSDFHFYVLSLKHHAVYTVILEFVYLALVTILKYK